ncbi:poly-beta-1,6 N-acetyl-D-glucosamine export porin PgaA [Guyparkeria sp. XI15]|nr:poly-beta-1,6 N-acetyl-D-glucosamine export porin PgaA [Guyparkeria sp. XI15]OAE86701.1 poly-beta-1,6 N-acetyl-D-glucosamine export porin PgaA [Guyparkeria sp. WRN-7]
MFACVAQPVSAATVAEQRHAAVELAGQGQLDRAIEQLRRLAEQHPSNGRVLADLIVLLRQAGDNPAIRERMAGIPPETVPRYAHLAWAGALRDERRFADAATILRRSHDQLGTPGRILYGVVSAEAGDAATATAVLDSITPLPDSPQQLAMIAYGLRVAGQPRQALLRANRALEIDAGHPLAAQQQNLALWQLGAAEHALDQVNRHPDRFAASTRLQIEADANAAAVRHAIAQRDALSDTPLTARRNRALEAALLRIDRFIERAPAGHPQRLRARLDRLVVLRQLERMPEAIAAYEELPDQTAALPPFARRAAADAYLAERQPERAIPLYQSLNRADTPADLDLLLALYYAHLANEDYATATDLLDHAEAVTPTWLPAPAGREAQPNWERIGVDQLGALDPAYRQHEAQAWSRADTLVARAPAHAGLRNTQARVARWRGWPERSRQLTQTAASWAPEALDTRLNQAANARDLGEYDRWAAILSGLQSDYPRDSRVRRQADELADRDRPSIEGELTVGRTRGGTGVVTGNRDLNWRARLNSAWTSEDWRVFAEHRRTTATFDQTKGRHDRVGIGIEWAALRRQLWLRVDRERLGDTDPGVAAGGSIWLDDHWQLSAEADSHSIETPLRADDAGLSGWSASTTLYWRAHESLNAYVTTGLLTIDDGNRRWSAAAGATRRVQASAHHLTNVGADVFYQHNSSPGGPYFNPRYSASGTLRAEHEWITWRQYERSFTQTFFAAAGMGLQADYGSHPMVEARYGHRWALDRRWSVEYQVGWQSTAYDGERERRLYGTVGFRGIF